MYVVICRGVNGWWWARSWSERTGNEFISASSRDALIAGLSGEVL